MIEMKRPSSEKVGRALKVRAKIDSARPEFIRSEHTRFPRLGKKWRSSKGIRSKMRLKKKSRAPIVETGYRGPAIARGLRMDGKAEVMVFRVEDLARVDKEKQVVRISGTVGKRKRGEILDKARELEITVLNRRPSEVKVEEPITEELKKPVEAEEEAEGEEGEEEAEEEEEPKPEPKKTRSKKPPEPAKEEALEEQGEEEDEEE